MATAPRVNISLIWPPPRAAKPPVPGRRSRPGWACLGNMRAVIQKWENHFGAKSEALGSVYSVVFVTQITVSTNWPHLFTCFFKHKLDSVDAYMTIKPHFNRSTTTKTVSRVPVSCEISMWKSHLRETRLHLFFFFFRGLIVSFQNTHTHYTIFNKIPLAL